MKRLFTFFLLVPFLSFSQSERSQKIETRNTGTYRSQPSQPSSQSYSPSRSSIEYSQKQSERSNNRYQPGPSRNNDRYPPSLIFGNRWNLWGAPMFGFNYWNPGYWYDPFGYRQPARIYYYDNGRADTIRGKATRVSFGIQYSTDKKIGGFLTIGNKGYFIADYSAAFQKDESTYYPDLTKDKVIPWGDQKLEDLYSGGVLYLGAGKRFARTGFHVMVGLGRETKRYQFFDEMFILSNNGKYSILNYTDNFTTIKFGVIHDFKRASIKIDLDPIRKNTSIGLGLNL
jgi:hypothetical protein